MFNLKHYGLRTVRAIMTIAEEYTFGKMLRQHSAVTFLDRMMQISSVKPLKRLADSGHLKDVMEKCKEEVHREASEKSVVERIIKGGGPSDLDDHDTEEIARQRLEEQRAIANVIVLAIVICAHFSKGDGKYNGLWPYS
jgi:hypothetical protein